MAADIHRLDEAIAPVYCDALDGRDLRAPEAKHGLDMLPPCCILLSKSPHNFLEAVPFSRRPNLGLGVTEGADQRRNFARRFDVLRAEDI